jgi:branched-chain amino acid transport system substrate-binding protein
VKARTIVTVHDGSRYAQQLTVVTATNFTKLGGKVVSQEAIAPTDIDMHPVLTRVAAEKPDVLYIPVFVAAAAQILRQSKETPGLEHTTVGGGSLAAAGFIEAAGPAVIGFRICSIDISPESMGQQYPEFIAKYTRMFGEGPISNGNANSYDAAVMAFTAIKQVAKADSDGNLYIGKRALLDAVFAVKFDGLSGGIACDTYGQCASFQAWRLRIRVGGSENLLNRQEPEEGLAVGSTQRRRSPP